MTRFLKSYDFTPEGRQKFEPYQSIKIRAGINIGNMGQLDILESLVLGQSDSGDKLRCGGLICKLVERPQPDWFGGLNIVYILIWSTYSCLL